MAKETWRGFAEGGGEAISEDSWPRGGERKRCSPQLPIPTLKPPQQREPDQQPQPEYPRVGTGPFGGLHPVYSCFPLGVLRWGLWPTCPPLPA